MYSLGLLIVELETARRRLRYAFEVPDGTLTRRRDTVGRLFGPSGTEAL